MMAVDIWALIAVAMLALLIGIAIGHGLGYDKGREVGWAESEAAWRRPKV